MVQGIDERQCGSTVEGSSIVQCGGNAHRCFVDIWDAEIDFSHIGMACRVK